MNRGGGRKAAVLSAAAMMLGAGSARATWSIIIVDTRTREIAVGSATCLTGFDLQANTPVVIVGVGAATAQSAVDSDATNRTFIRDGLFAGDPLETILAGLAQRDSSHQSRQYGVVDFGGPALTFTGSQAGAWAGGRVGQSGDLVYAVQGNVITGQAVVDAAIDAIEITPGDLAEKLMAGMEAARMMGGDGRCSCPSGQPDACGSPPPSFNKSAHIAYMIVARIGDRDGSNGAYRVQGSGSQSAFIDTNGDGFPEHVNGGGSSIAVRPNITQPGQPPILGPYAFTPNSSSLRGIAWGDFNADQAVDVAFGAVNEGKVIVFAGTNGFAFADGVKYPTGAGPTAVGTGDFNGDGIDDLATLNTGDLTVGVLLSMGLEFAAPLLTGVPAGTNQLQVGDLDNDGDADVVVASGSARQIIVYRNAGDGTLTPETPITFGLQPISLLLADINGDHRLDIVHVLSSEKQVRILRQEASGDFTTLAFATQQAPNGVNVADVDGDSFADIVFVQSLVGSARLSVMRGQEDGTFLPPINYPIGSNGSNCAVTDLNGDGAPDAAVPQAGGTAIMLMANAGAKFNAISGLAGGDYFLDFNVANQTGGAEDPVFQLRSQFQAWAAALEGVPDATRSTVTFDPPAAWANGVSPAYLVVRARDRSDAPVPIDAQGVTIESLAPSPRGVVGTPLNGPEGTVLVPVTPGTACETETFRVHLAAGDRLITLMPDVTMTYTSPADVDRNGFVNGDDFDAFMAAFVDGQDAIDVNGDGFINGDDFDYFLDRFVTGC